MFKVSTKADKTAAAKETVVTIVYDNATAERALATQAAIIRAQAGWRKNGIPAEATIKMSENMPGTRAAPVSLQDAVKSLSPEEKAKLIAELQASMK